MENFKSLFKPKRIKTFLLMTFFPFVQGGYCTSECSFFLLRRFVFRLRHLHICHYSPYLPPKILHNLFFFHFSWVLQPYQEKLKTMLMQNLRGQIRYMGDVQVAHKASARLVTNRKEPWEGERREAKRVPPVFSFPPPFSRKFLSRERERLSTYEEPSSPFLILVKYEQNSQNFS